MTDQGEVRCSSCGASNSPTARFCGNCGGAIPEAPACASCGAELHPGARFCRHCGAVVGTPAVVGQPAISSAPGGPRNRRLWLGLGALAAIGSVLIGVLASRGGGDQNGGTSGQALQVNHDGRLTLGASTALANKTVTTAGGSVVVQKAGDPLNGFQLDVPAKAFDGSRTFAVSYRPITGQTFGTGVNPISPLIKVDYGEGFTNQSMTVRVPVSLAAGRFAMPFYYNEATGKIEAIPMAEIAADHVTLIANHFSDFFITSISEDDLLNAGFDSGFEPGTDDWQFVNYGSYVATHGQCAGQSMSAMWYYYERRLGGAPQLNGRYDNDGAPNAKTPSIWEDDVLGYRLASTVHHDYAANWDASAESRGFYAKLAALDDRYSFLEAAYAIYLTGGPQFLDIRGSGGHAIVAYKVANRRIYVSDPNTPGDAGRWIDLKDGKLLPYNGAQSAKDPPQLYDRIRFIAVSAMIDWNLIGKRWAEFDAGTVGTGLFPDFEVGVYDLQGHGYLVKDVLAVTGTEQMLWSNIPTTKDITVITAYIDGRWNPGRLIEGDAASNITVNLKQGDNDVGIAMGAAPAGSRLGSGYNWVGFSRYKITVIGPISISAPASVAAAQPVSFSASASAPVSGPTFEWDFGDGTTPVRSRTAVSHTFTKAGSYRVIVTAFDGPTGKYGGQGTVTVTTGAATTPTAIPSRPTSTPTSKYDCSKPPGPEVGSIERLGWELACGGPIGGR